MIDKFTILDKEWLFALFKENEHELNSDWVKALASWSIASSNIIVIRPWAFLRYTISNGNTIIHELCVDKNHRRKGFAKILIKSLKTPIIVGCLTSAKEANALYKSMGFEEWGTNIQGNVSFNTYCLPQK